MLLRQERLGRGELFSPEQFVPTLNSQRSARLSPLKLHRFLIAALCASSFAIYAAGLVPGTISTPNELIASGRYQLAADALLQILRDPNVAGQETENSAALLTNLGFAYEKLGRYMEGEATLLKALRMYSDLDQTQSLSYGRTLNNLANVYLNQKRYTKCEDMFKDALALYRARFSENDGDIALVLNNIGLTRLMTGDSAQAEQYFRESLELQRKMKVSTGALAVTLNNMALACKHQGRVEEAARIYGEAIEVWRNTLGARHPEVAVGLQNLASLETLMRRNEPAEKHFLEALSVVEAILPLDDPTRTAILTNYADLLSNMGRKREAKQMQATAHTIRAMHDRENFQHLTIDVRRLMQ